MIIYTIYRIVNKINGKVYIGFTSRNPPHKRWASHLSQLNNPKYNKLLLYKAINKYGKDFFEFDILYQSKNRNHTLKIMEPYFIKEYNSFGLDGYNLTEGGEGTFGHSKVSWCKGKTGIFSIETLNKLSESKIGNKNAAGYLHTEESRQKMRLFALSRDYSYLHKKVITPKGEFNSLTEAANYYNMSKAWVTKQLKNKNFKLVI
jgi:group I intron endonuclease